jgi:hypothetical protein
MGSSPHKEGEPFAILLKIRAIKKSGTLHFTRLQERHEGNLAIAGQIVEGWKLGDV